MSAELLGLNVNEHTEKKGGLSYLSWAWAWAEALKADPAATWVVHTYGPKESAQPCMWIGDTAMVHVSVTIKGLCRECMLPVMDNRNNAIKSPDARKISDSIMRCMTKALSMHGLGLYIYAGEDLPETPVTPESGADKAERERKEARAAELDELTLYLIDCGEQGSEMQAALEFYRLESCDDSVDAMKYVWSNLQPHSKLRAAIKANSALAREQIKGESK